MAEPIKDMESFVHRSIEQRRAEARKAGKIPRPMNSFMLYRSAYAERVKTWYAQNNHQVVSLAAGASWRNETEEIKDKYNALAKIEKQNHMKAHPGYKFAPSKDKRKRGILSDDRSFFSDTNSTPRGSPALSSFSSPEIGSSSSRFSNRSTPFDMADHGLPTDSYLASSWPRSNPATRPSSGMMLTSDPSLYHSAYYEYAGLGRQDMDELQYPSTALAGLPGAAHQDLLQGQPQMPAAELGQLDPQLLQYTSGPPHPDASDPYGSSQASVWDDAPENNYASPPAGPSSLPYAGPSSYHPEVQALADSQRWPLDASDSFDQFLNGNPPAY
ncbi:hypothetical protein BJX61DRAFT_523335 [Aspergillus egyptiacus]|nr:hypothetical protein BJX61DRAFT_523335 [Aspergillus egyptiacus]